MTFTLYQQHALIKAVSRAPSVHNVQPARFYFKDANIFLIEDITRRIPFADPTGRDTDFSLGIATEGLRIELLNHGYKLIDSGECNHDFNFGKNFNTLRRFEIIKGGKPDILSPYTEKRYSHRGKFFKPTDHDIQRIKNLSGDDKYIISDKQQLARIGKIYDIASLNFFRDKNFRAEILSWMRLDKSHPKWLIDGLNYEAMAMSSIEGFVANIILGPKIFPILDKIGLSGALTAEAEKINDCAGVLLLHRPKSETPFESGRYFYRTWLEIVENGFQAAVMAALADDNFCQTELCKFYNIDQERRIITSFRIGRTDNVFKPARLKPEDLILQ